jgi:hypothetical protein
MNNTKKILSDAYDLIQQDQFDEAIVLLRPVLVEEPDNADAWWLMANAATEPGDARRALVNVIKNDPSHTRAREMLEQLNEAYPPQTDEDYRLLSEIYDVQEDDFFAAELKKEDDDLDELPDFDEDFDPFADVLEDEQPSKAPAAATAEKKSGGRRRRLLLVATILVVVLVVVIVLASSSGGDDGDESDEDTTEQVADDADTQTDTPDGDSQDAMAAATGTDAPEPTDDAATQNGDGDLTTEDDTTDTTPPGVEENGDTQTGVDDTDNVSETDLPPGDETTGEVTTPPDANDTNGDSEETMTTEDPTDTAPPPVSDGVGGQPDVDSLEPLSPAMLNDLGLTTFVEDVDASLALLDDVFGTQGETVVADTEAGNTVYIDTCVCLTPECDGPTPDTLTSMSYEGLRLLGSSLAADTIAQTNLDAFGVNVTVCDSESADTVHRVFVNLSDVRDADDSIDTTLINNPDEFRQAWTYSEG